MCNLLSADADICVHTMPTSPRPVIQAAVSGWPRNIASILHLPRSTGTGFFVVSRTLRAYIIERALNLRNVRPVCSTFRRRASVPATAPPLLIGERIPFRLSASEVPEQIELVHASRGKE